MQAKKEPDRKSHPVAVPGGHFRSGDSISGARSLRRASKELPSELASDGPKGQGFSDRRHFGQQAFPAVGKAEGLAKPRARSEVPTSSKNKAQGRRPGALRSHFGKTELE